jgi:hypothetical protein
MHPDIRSKLVELMQSMDLQTMQDRMQARMQEEMFKRMDSAAILEWRKDMSKHEHHRNFHQKAPQSEHFVK